MEPFLAAAIPLVYVADVCYTNRKWDQERNFRTAGTLSVSKQRRAVILQPRDPCSVIAIHRRPATGNRPADCLRANGEPLCSD